MRGTKNIGVYIHIPFCVQKCLYCDFVSFADRNETMAAYKEALIKEISAAELGGYCISSVFIGGGTPTALPGRYIEEIMAALSRHSILENGEITIEANPKTLSKEMLRSLKSAGINRLSMGLQAWQDKLLHRLGRVHHLGDFIENFNDAVAAGFSNINVDLMFGLPDQDFNDWAETLENVAALNPAHISAYSLIVEEGTPFAREYDKGNLFLPGEDEEREMYWHTREFLLGRGYGQYEISNFAKPDFYSRHNVLYWERGFYRGFGLAAHSFMEEVRFSNTEDLDQYIQVSGEKAGPMAEKDILSLEDAMSEFMFLGLRLTRGVDIQKFRQEFGRGIEDVFPAAVKKNMDNKLLVKNGNRLFLTPRGVDISNRIMADFLI